MQEGLKDLRIILSLGISLMCISMYFLPNTSRLRPPAGRRVRITGEHIIPSSLGPGVKIIKSGMDEAFVSRPTVWLGMHTNMRRRTRDEKHGLGLQGLFLSRGYNLCIGRSYTTAADTFDLFWSQHSPYGHLPLAEIVSRTSAGKILHFPRSLEAITSKGELVSTLKAAFIPAAFQLSADLRQFKQFVTSHPETRYVRKGSKTEGVSLLTDEEVKDLLGNRNVASTLKGTDRLRQSHFVQEFIADPFLLDQRKIETRFHVAVTSVKPMRAYLYIREFHFRVCERPHTFGSGSDENDDDLLGYVCNEGARGDPFQFSNDPILAGSRKLQFYPQHLVNLFLDKSGISRESILKQMHDLSAVTLRHAAETETKALEREHPDLMPSISRNYFELLRYDVQVDQSGLVNLIEVNHIPGVGAGRATSENSARFVDLLGVLGANTLFMKDGRTLRMETGEEIQSFLVPQRELSVFADLCSSLTCFSGCVDARCLLCDRCISSETKRHITNAYMEHINQGLAWERVHASDERNRKSVQEQKSERHDGNAYPVGSADHLLEIWLEGKCIQEYTWCS